MVSWLYSESAKQARRGDTLEANKSQAHKQAGKTEICLPVCHLGLVLKISSPRCPWVISDSAPEPH